jgi:hypothetical protein
MRCHALQSIVAGSTRVVSSPRPETSSLARSCNKAERERYFVFGEPLSHEPDWFGDTLGTQSIYVPGGFPELLQDIHNFTNNVKERTVVRPVRQPRCEAAAD